MIATCTQCLQLVETTTEEAGNPTFICQRCHIARQSETYVQLAHHEAAIVRFVLGSRHTIDVPRASVGKAVELVRATLNDLPPEFAGDRSELTALLTILTGTQNRINGKAG